MLSIGGALVSSETRKANARVCVIIIYSSRDCIDLEGGRCHVEV